MKKSVSGSKDQSAPKYVDEVEWMPDFSTLGDDVAASEELANAKVLIDEYANTETAKFIIGTRSFDELDAYLDEMERLSADYLQTYADYYASLQ